MKAITDQQGMVLLNYARSVLTSQFDKEEQVVVPEDAAFDNLGGVFVTLKMAGNLRGCIGNIEPVRSIKEGVAANVVSAAFHDTRFAPLSRKELEQVHISISILTKPEPLIYSSAEDLCKRLKKGVDGVILRFGHNSATFLPQVWEQLPVVESFLSHLSLKAGLSMDGWKDTNVEISTYQVQSFAEGEE
jgi:AmmeMemoRadiSam system protein A